MSFPASIATTMKIRGATLYYEVRGSGPILFRGDHNIAAHPAAFAETLDGVLRDDA